MRGAGRGASLVHTLHQILWGVPLRTSWEEPVTWCSREKRTIAPSGSRGCRKQKIRHLLWNEPEKKKNGSPRGKKVALCSGNRNKHQNESKVAPPRRLFTCWQCPKSVLNITVSCHSSLRGPLPWWHHVTCINQCLTPTPNFEFFGLLQVIQSHLWTLKSEKLLVFYYNYLFLHLLVFFLSS